jgi:hypothetical protein
VVVPLLIVVLLREEPDALGRDASIYFVNKALGCAALQMRQLLPFPSLAGRGGGGEEEALVGSHLKLGGGTKLRSRRSRGVHHQQLFNGGSSSPPSC